MINSPLEQFNVLSVSDLSLINISIFEIIYAKFLLWFWYNVSSFLSHIQFISTIFENILPFLNNLSVFTASLIETQVIQVYIIIDWLYSIYFNIISRIWYIIYSDVTILYSTDHLFFIKFFDILFAMVNPNFSINTQEISVSTGYLCTGISANTALLTETFGVSLVNIYLMITLTVLPVWVFIYQTLIEPFFYLSTKDFSYLIFSLNNSTIWMTIAFLFITFLFIVSLKTNSLIPKNNWQILLGSFYELILTVVYENAGPKNIKYFPLIFTTFIIILICNLLGMIPYSFTITSHIIVTFSTAFAIFIGINIIGVSKHGKHFLGLFFPPGAPLPLALLLVIIEFVSYVFRVFSLSIRLFANLMSGHTLLKILSGFAWISVSFWGIFLIPIGIIFIITGLELMIACLQAYIFVVLLCIYINDAINLH